MLIVHMCVCVLSTVGNGYWLYGLLELGRKLKCRTEHSPPFRATAPIGTKCDGVNVKIGVRHGEKRVSRKCLLKSTFNTAKFQVKTK